MKSAIESVQYFFMKYGTSDNITTIGIVLIAVLLVVSIYKMLKSFHPAMVFFVIGLLGVGLFLYWVHNRNEPDFMTPAVEAVAQFLPTKDPLRQYEGPQ